jgi:hypothetical protein
VNALHRIHRSLVPGGVVFDLQPVLGNAPVVNSSRILGRLDEREFRAFADRVNSLLQETISAGLFAQEREIVITVGAQIQRGGPTSDRGQTWTGDDSAASA